MASNTIQPISINTVGDHIVIAAQSAPIWVMRVVLSLDSETTVQFKRGAIDLSGPMTALVIVLDENKGVPWYITNPGEPFVITLGASIQCGGTIWFSNGPS